MVMGSKLSGPALLVCVVEIRTTYIDGHGSEDEQIGEIESKSGDEEPKLILLHNRR